MPLRHTRLTHVLTIEPEMAKFELRFPKPDTDNLIECRNKPDVYGNNITDLTGHTSLTACCKIAPPDLQAQKIPPYSGIDCC